MEKDSSKKTVKPIHGEEAVPRSDSSTTELYELVSRLDTDEVKLLLTHISDIVWILDLELNTIFVSPSIENVLGFTSSERKRQKIEEMITPESLERAKERFELEFGRDSDENIKSGRSVTIEVEYYRKDGSTVWVENSIRAIRGSNSEMIGLVGSSRDISERKDTEDKLTRMARQWETTFDSSPDVIWILDSEQRILRSNKAAEKLFGHPVQELIGRKCYEVVHTTDQPIPECPYKKMKKSLLREQMELRIEDRFFLVTVDPILNDRNEHEGSIHAVRDITRLKQSELELKAALAEKQMLLREVHHRVKNNMQVISGLLALQASTTQLAEVKEALQESQGRINALSAVHRLLHASDSSSRIDLKVHLVELASGLFQSLTIRPEQIKLEEHIEPLTVSIAQASTLGLVFNELISNALKHAFPEGKRGKIIITGREEGDIVLLTMSDNGVGFPDNFDWQNTATLGLKLVRMLVENQLEGTVDLAGGNGTVFTIRFSMEI